MTKEPGGWRQAMSNQQKERSKFWKRIAKAELALQRKLELEFTRHEEAVRKIIIEMRAARKP